MSVENSSVVKNKGVRETFFYLGIIGAIGLRLVLILNNVNPIYAKVAWYVAMLALTAYYYYRKWIELKRRQMIIDDNLIAKVRNSKLGKSDREKLSILLGSIIVSKQMLNLNILLYASIVAVAIQIIIDLKFT